MTEAQFNTIIGNSLDWHHKISDGSYGQKPYDGFGALAGRPVYWEAKWLRKPAAFPWSRLESHQIEGLIAMQKNIPAALSWLIIGVDYGRGDKRVFLFDNLEEIRTRKRSEEKSIKKKEFDSLPYTKVAYQLIPKEYLLERILEAPLHC